MYIVAKIKKEERDRERQRERKRERERERDGRHTITNFKTNKQTRIIIYNIQGGYNFLFLAQRSKIFITHKAERIYLLKWWRSTVFVTVFNFSKQSRSKPSHIRTSKKSTPSWVITLNSSLSPFVAIMWSELEAAIANRMHSISIADKLGKFLLDTKRPH